MNAPGRRYRAGESIEDFCRACKTDRMHTVVAADENGLPIRVSCGFCHSEHNYRGGPRVGLTPGASPGDPKTASTSQVGAIRSSPDREPLGAEARSAKAAFPIVSERERTGPPMPTGH